MNLLTKSDNHLKNANANASGLNQMNMWAIYLIRLFVALIQSYSPLAAILVLVKLVIGFCPGKDTV